MSSMGTATGLNSLLAQALQKDMRGLGRLHIANKVHSKAGLWIISLVTLNAKKRKKIQNSNRKESRNRGRHGEATWLS